LIRFTRTGGWGKQFSDWSGQAESNRRLILGKDVYYHYTMPAFVPGGMIELPTPCLAQSRGKIFSLPRKICRAEGQDRTADTAIFSRVLYH
jgi:hypothetical protein